MKSIEKFKTETKIKLLYLTPLNAKEKGGMTEITKMFFEVGLFENPQIRHFNTYFRWSQSKLIRFIESIYLQLKFVKTLLFFRPDIVFVMTSAYWGFFEKSFYCLVARIFGVKCMLNQVGDFADFYSRNNPTKILVKFCLRFPNAILVGSTFWNSFFNTEFPNRKIVSVVNPVLCDKFSRGSTSSSKIRVVTISSIIESKGIIELVGVIKRVCQDSDAFVFVIMGGGDRLDWVIKELNGEVERGCVEIKGFVTDSEKEECFSTADLFVQLSHNEVIPIAILEAMSASLPIISSDVGGIPDIVYPGINGYLFPRKTVEPVAMKILELSGEKELLFQMGSKSLEIVRREYDVLQVLEKHISIAESL